MRTSRVVAAIAVAVLATACGEPAETPGDGAGPVEGTEAAGGGDESRVSGRHVQIYSAVIHQVIEVDNTFGGAGKKVPFDHVLIDTLIGSERSGMGDEPQDAGPLLAPEMQEALSAELADLPDVRFVDGEEAINKKEGGLKMPEAALVSLGVIPDGEDRVEVKVGMLCGSLCGAWMTYVVVAEDDGWKVTGTTGPIGIS